MSCVFFVPAYRMCHSHLEVLLDQGDQGDQGDWGLSRVLLACLAGLAHLEAKYTGVNKVT